MFQSRQSHSARHVVNTRPQPGRLTLAPVPPRSFLTRLAHWLHNLATGRPSSHITPAPVPPRHRTRRFPKLEQLDDRILPTTFLAVEDIYFVNHDHQLTGYAAYGEPLGLLNNDYHSECLPFSIVRFGAAGQVGIPYLMPSNSTITLEADGSFLFQPAAHWTGSESFSYVISDGTNEATGEAIFMVTNTPPAPAEDYFSIAMNDTLTGSPNSYWTPGLLDNDTNTDGDPQSITAVNNQANLVGTAFTTAMGGTLTVQANGAFTYQPANNWSGTDMFNYTVSDGVATGTASVYIAVAQGNPPPPPPPQYNMPPQLSMNIAYGARRSLTITGVVNDEAPGGLEVVLSGSVTAWVSVNNDGTFYLYVSEAIALGPVQGSTTDAQGLQSNTVTLAITSAPPAIENFVLMPAMDGFFTFTGRVVDESAANLVVTFGGLPCLVGQTVTTDANGNFTFTIFIPLSQRGQVTAQVTDWWGLESEIVYEYVM